MCEVILTPVYSCDEGEIVYASGCKLFECLSCGKVFRFTKGTKQNLETCLCGGPLLPLDSKLIVHLKNGKILSPTYKRLGEYLLSHPDWMNIIEMVYKCDTLPYEDDKLVDNYILHLFRNEELNYPKPRYLGNRYTYEFFKMVHETGELDLALKVFKCES